MEGWSDGIGWSHLIGVENYAVGGILVASAARRHRAPSHGSDSVFQGPDLTDLCQTPFSRREPAGNGKVDRIVDTAPPKESEALPPVAEGP